MAPCMFVQLFKLLSVEGTRQLASRSGRKINTALPLKIRPVAGVNCKAVNRRFLALCAAAKVLRINIKIFKIKLVPKLSFKNSMIPWISKVRNEIFRQMTLTLTLTLGRTGTSNGRERVKVPLNSYQLLLAIFKIFLLVRQRTTRREGVPRIIIKIFKIKLVLKLSFKHSMILWISKFFA